MSRRFPPVWLIPNLLSLDAPLVAVAWLYIFAKTWRVDYHPWHPYAALALVVWGIYATDRVLDASLHGRDGALSMRHRVHQRIRKWLSVAVPLAFCGALAIALIFLPSAIVGYAAVAVVLVLGFFATALFAGGRREIPYTKNLLAGLAFGFGTAIGAHVYVFTEDVFGLIRSPEMLSFALLCTLNITAVDLWEHGRRSGDAETGAADELALTLPLALLAGFALLFALRADPFTRPFYYSILVAAAALQVVNRIRHRVSPDALRVAADLCLLAPWVYFVLA